MHVNINVGVYWVAVRTHGKRERERERKKEREREHLYDEIKLIKFEVFHKSINRRVIYDGGDNCGDDQ